MGNLALYQLTGAYLGLVNKLSEGDFDLQTIADSIEASGITDEIAAKAAGIEMVARTMEMHTPAIDIEIVRLTALKKQRQGAAAGLRDYLKANMIAGGITRLESPLFKISLQNNPPAVEIFDAAMVPAAFMTQPVAPAPAPDKTAIKGAIKAGIEVAGCRMTAGQRLVIA